MDYFGVSRHEKKTKINKAEFFVFFIATLLFNFAGIKVIYNNINILPHWLKGDRLTYERDVNSIHLFNFEKRS